MKVRKNLQILVVLVLVGIALLIVTGCAREATKAPASDESIITTTRCVNDTLVVTNPVPGQRYSSSGNCIFTVFESVKPKNGHAYIEPHSNRTYFDVRSDGSVTSLEFVIYSNQHQPDGCDTINTACEAISCLKPN